MLGRATYYKRRSRLALGLEVVQAGVLHAGDTRDGGERLANQQARGGHPGRLQVICTSWEVVVASSRGYQWLLKAAKANRRYRGL